MIAHATLDLSDEEDQVLVDLIARWDIVDYGPGTPKINEITSPRIVGVEINQQRVDLQHLTEFLAKLAPHITVDNPELEWLDEEGNQL